MDKNKIEYYLKMVEGSIKEIRDEMVIDDVDNVPGPPNTISNVTEDNPKISITKGKDRGLIDDKLYNSGQVIEGFIRKSKGLDD